MSGSNSPTQPAVGNSMDQVPDFYHYRARAHYERQMAINAAMRALWQRLRRPRTVTGPDARPIAG